MKHAVRHLAGIQQLFMQRANLQAAEQIRSLVERTIITNERSPHLSNRILALMSDAFHQHVDTLLRRHLLQVKA